MSGTPLRRRLIGGIVVLTLAGPSGTGAQQPVFPITDKISGLAGAWTREASRGTGGICGVSEVETVSFEVQPESITVAGRIRARVPLLGAATSDDGLVTATTDAGWLKLTMTMPRTGGYANVMQEVYILNRDRSELTLWRTLNVRMPDGTSGKIDCGNRAAVVYRRQTAP